MVLFGVLCMAMAAFGICVGLGLRAVVGNQDPPGRSQPLATAYRWALGIGFAVGVISVLLGLATGR